MAEPEHTEPAPRRGLRKTAARAGAVAWAALKAIRAARFVLRRCIEALLALIILFEEWGWRPLAALLGEAGAAGAHRPAGGGDCQPAALSGAAGVRTAGAWRLLPLKLLALSLIATGHVVLGRSAVRRRQGRRHGAGRAHLPADAAEADATGVVCALSTTSFMPWKEALIARVRQSPVWQAGKAIKERAKTAAKAAWVRWQPALEPIVARLRSLLRRG